MTSSNDIRRAVRQVLLVGMVGTALTPFVVFAADAPDSGKVLGEVVVTGSRIARPELESPVPVSVISNEALEATGLTNVADVLREMPGVGTAALSSTNSNFLTSGSGVNSVNLRNLGDQRTLVLVNGRRFTPGLAGSSIVDLNMIPEDFIEKVEVITGGASAIYGSDAIAGAVNIIYKTNFEGVRIRGQGGATGEGDAAHYLGSLTVGDSLADGRGHFMLNLSYDKDEGLKSNQRDRSSVDQQVSPVTGLITKPSFSSFAPQGRFTYADLCSDVADPTVLPQCASGPPATGINGLFTFNANNTVKNGFVGAADGFNRNAYRLISVPTNRALLAATANYELAENQQFYTEMTYGITRTQSQLEPFALASSSSPGSVYNNAVDVNGDLIGVPITNAYIPASVLSTITAWNTANPTDPISYIQFRKRLLDIADRGADAKRQTMRVVTGVKGDLPFLSDWTYDASYVYGRTTDNQVSSGQVDLNNFRAALNTAVVGGNIVCADPVAQSFGCVPINMFGYNSITPAAAAFVNAPATRDVTIQEQVFGANVTGPILHLPAGDWMLVAGVEDRKDSSDEVMDSLTNSGQNGGNALPNVHGSIETKEEFIEMDIPILKDLPGANLLSFNAADRHADYSTVGSVNTWKVGLEWAPIQDVRFRGVYSEAIRAPNIGELYGGQAQTFPAVVDPCDGVTATSVGQYDAACRAIPSVARGLPINYTLLDYQGIFGFDGSNPSLQQEKAKTTTLGLVFRPEVLHNFTATVDWFDIKIENAVNSIDRQTSINQCLLTGEAGFCGSVFRSPTTGKILSVNALLVNLSSIRTTGFDTTLRYAFDLSRFGKITLGVTETHLTKLEQSSFPGAEVQDNLGELNSGGRLGSGFRDRGTLTAYYDMGPFTASWTATYMSSIYDTLPTPDNTVVSRLYNTVPAYMYHDVQFRYRIGDESKRNIVVYLGAKNVFNKQPPLLPSGMASETTGTETAADTYDVFGRFIYGGFEVKL